MNLLEKIKKLLYKDRNKEKFDYQEYYILLSCEIDKLLDNYIGSKELAKNCFELFKQWNRRSKIFDIAKEYVKNNKFKTKIPLEKSKEIAYEFYNRISTEFGNEFNDILNGKDAIKVNWVPMKIEPWDVKSHVEVPRDAFEHYSITMED